MPQGVGSVAVRMLLYTSMQRCEAGAWIEGRLVFCPSPLHHTLPPSLFDFKCPQPLKWDTCRIRVGGSVYECENRMGIPTLLLYRMQSSVRIDTDQMVSPVFCLYYSIAQYRINASSLQSIFWDSLMQSEWERHLWTKVYILIWEQHLK